MSSAKTLRARCCMMKYIYLLSLTLILIACGKAKRPDSMDWDGVAQPLVSESSEKRFSALPLKGRAGNNQRYWSGDYWALKKGLINYRWFSGEYGFDLNSPDQYQAAQ